MVKSLVFYKVKHNNDASLSHNPRIAPHRKEGSPKDVFTNACTVCSPTRFRFLETIAILFCWTLYKVDVKIAFLQTGLADRQSFIKPPSKSQMHSGQLWLLMTAAYGPGLPIAKWQVQSDAFFYELGLLQCQLISQIIFK